MNTKKNMPEVAKLIVVLLMCKFYLKSCLTYIYILKNKKFHCTNLNNIIKFIDCKTMDN